jgi:protein SCO1/2
VALLLAVAGCGSDTDELAGDTETGAVDGADASTDSADRGESGRSYAGYERTPTPEVGDLSLPAVEPDGSETDFPFAADDDGLLLVYFGYTLCPDVCPTTLSDLRLVLEELGDDAERIDLAMVTIDPEFDSAEVLAGYVRSFIPDATVIRTDDDSQLREVTDAFGADYGVDEVDGEREVYHTGSVYAVNASGELVLTWPFGTPSDDVVADLDQLLEVEA